VSMIETEDGTEIYYKDWVRGKSVSTDPKETVHG
jgi:hypothetical protein